MGLSIPFRLDDSLGPNRADVLLVMCSFSSRVAGQFTVAVSETAFQVTSVEITADPFELHFADDFPVRITDLRVERDTTVELSSGTLIDSTSSGQFQVESEVHVQIRMQAHFQGIAEWIAFKTPFLLSGTIERNRINLTGRFTFHMEGYSEESMATKLGTSDVILNATSLLACQLFPDREANTLQLAFAGREARLSVGGSFTLGLDGLDIRVLELTLAASPLHFPGLLSTEEILITIDSSAIPVPVDFTLEMTTGKEKQRVQGDNPGESPVGIHSYGVLATIPARMRTLVTFQGFSSQPLEAYLLLNLQGSAALEETLHLDLNKEVEVAIGDGRITLEVEAHLEAQLSALTETTTDVTDPRRALYAALLAVPEKPYGRELEPLRQILAEPDSTARFLAVSALERTGDASVLPLLVSVLEDTTPTVRAAAASALGRIGGVAQTEVLLSRVTHDSDDSVRLASLLALAELEAPTWLEAVHIAIHDPNEVLRCQAALIIGRRGSMSSIGPLFEALNDPNHFVQLCAGLALLSAGREEAIATIARMVREDRDICVQMIGSIALGQTSQEEARTTLQSKLETSDDIFVRQAVLYALARQGGS